MVTCENRFELDIMLRTAVGNPLGSGGITRGE
jgi:hypothetical protein